MQDAKARLDKVYQAATPEQLRESYQAWAAHYEADLVGQMGYDKPERVGEALLEVTTPQSRILDVGTGTGLVGAFLSRHGYQDLTGLDFCEGMLEHARARGVYRELLQMDLGLPLDLASGRFDAVVGVGVFTEGHASPKCLWELVRVVRDGGHILFSLRDDVYTSMGFDKVQGELVEAKGWRLQERKQIADGLEGRPWSIWIYQVI